MIGGCSAGGTSAYLHLDWYAAHGPVTAKVRGLIDSGWFLPGSYTRDRKPDYGARMKELFGMVNASASLSAECIGAHEATDAYLCLFAPRMAPFIHTPLLALNSKFDASMGSGRYRTDDVAGRAAPAVAEATNAL